MMLDPAKAQKWSQLELTAYHNYTGQKCSHRNIVSSVLNILTHLEVTVEIGTNLLHTKGKSAGDKEQQVNQNDTPECKCQDTL